MTPRLCIVAHGACCAVGHNARAAGAAIRARMNHFRETEFTDESGRPLIGSSLYDIRIWGEARLHMMFHAVLGECMIQLPARTNDSMDTAILLLCAEAARVGQYGRHLAWAEHMLERSVTGGKFHETSRVLPLGKAGIANALCEARRLLQLKNGPEFVVVAGVDSYLDAPVIEAMLADGRLASTQNSDGFIPGEAAAAIALSLAAPSSGIRSAVWIEGIAEAREAATIGGEAPLRALGLSKAMRAAAADSGCQLADLDFHASGASGESWYARETGLALARALEKRVPTFPHHMVSKAVGEVGAACAPLTLAWLAQAMARPDRPGRRALAHFSGDDGLRAALVLRYAV